MKNWGIILISLFVACFVWVLHALSLNYSAYFQYKVVVNTDLMGYSNSAEANETLLLRGKASGYYILKARGFRGKPMDLSIPVDSKLLFPDDRIENTFILAVDDIREKIAENLEERISIDFFDTDYLSFQFTKQKYKKVPVTAVADISFGQQYMQTDEMVLKPDSVLVYGPESDISNITEIKTKPLYIHNLEKTVQGFVELDTGKGIKANTDNIHYTVKVDRYVESSKKIGIKVINVPNGKNVMLIPSEVLLTCRIPFGAQSESSFNSLSLVIDFNEMVSYKSAKVIPQLVKSDESRIFSYSLSPNLVECILVENR